MTPLVSIRNRLSRDTRGMALTEFGLILLPLMVVLLGAFDLGYQSYVRSVMQGALNEVARKAAVENPDFSGQSGNSVEEQIAAAIEERINGIARNGTYTIEQTNFFEFSGVGNPERLMTDNNGNGQYDAGDDDCFEDLNDNGQYDTNAGRSGLGGADDVVFYEVTVSMPRLLPVTGLYGVPDTYTIKAQAAIRNQPFAIQQVPAVECGI